MARCPFFCRALVLQVLALFFSPLGISAELVATGFSVKLDNVHYYISPFALAKAHPPCPGFASAPTVLGFQPVTVIHKNISMINLADLFSNWTQLDDVFTLAFTRGVFLAGSATQTACHSVVPLQGTDVPSGPYFLETATGNLHRVYRLYEDFAGAFMESVIPTPDGKFQVLSAKIPGAASLTVGVPSRLYSTRTESQPLAGVRVGVKDVFRVAGLKGSSGSRAWYSLYPPANRTATVIQNLIDAGAQIIGLQKTSQFANGEFATGDWVDYHSPFNPRGDGYQDPGSSTSGGAASIASYDWIDIAIGTDTGGSIRGPAGTQGLFGIRPSHGLVSLDNVMPLSPDLDTVGLIIRDPYLWDVANKVMYRNYTSYDMSPKYPTNVSTIFFPFNETETPDTVILFSFLAKLSKFLNTTVTPLNLTTAWSNSSPKGINGTNTTINASDTSIDTFLNTTYPVLITKHQATLVRDPFYADYAAAHNGRRPFVNPAPLIRWTYGDTLPSDAIARAQTELSIFKTWWNENIMPAAPFPISSDLNRTATTTTATDMKEEEVEEMCARAGLVLYAGLPSGIFPRYEYAPSPPGVPFGFHEGRVASFAGIPDAVFPVGEVELESPVTGKMEKFPVSINVMAAKGCDGMLVRLAQDLVKAGVITVPRVGT